MKHSSIDIEAKHLTISNSALTTWESCQRKFQNKYLKSLVARPTWAPPDFQPDQPIALVFGSAVHRALDTLWVTFDLKEATKVLLTYMEDNPPDKEDPKRSPGNGCALLAYYWHQWRDVITDPQWRTVDAESEFTLRLDGPGARDPLKWTIDYIGVIDKVQEHVSEPKWRIIDHKTTTFHTLYKTTAFSIGNQFQGYLAAFRELFQDEEVDLLIDLMIINRKEGSFNCYQEVVHPHPHLQSEWRLDTLTKASNIIARVEADYFPKSAPDPCSAWNQPCTFIELCLAKPEVENFMLDEAFAQREIKDGSL